MPGFREASPTVTWWNAAHQLGSPVAGSARRPTGPVEPPADPDARGAGCQERCGVAGLDAADGIDANVGGQHAAPGLQRRDAQHVGREHLERVAHRHRSARKASVAVATPGIDVRPRARVRSMTVDVHVRRQDQRGAGPRDRLDLLAPTARCPRRSRPGRRSARAAAGCCRAPAANSAAPRWSRCRTAPGIRRLRDGVRGDPAQDGDDGHRSPPCAAKAAPVRPISSPAARAMDSRPSKTASPGSSRAARPKAASAIA